MQMVWWCVQVMRAHVIFISPTQLADSHCSILHRIGDGQLLCPSEAR